MRDNNTATTMRPLRLLILAALVGGCTMLHAQEGRIWSPLLHTLQTIVNDDWMQPAVIELGSDDYVTVSFDFFSHEYHRFCCHLTHCNADWTPSDLLEVEAMDGFNDRPIEWYENSLNTTFLYTHYLVDYPNDDLVLKASGNYRVTIYDEDAEPDASGRQPLYNGHPVVAEACFKVVEPLVNVAAEVTANTDIDTHVSHQQLSFSLAHTGYAIDRPHDELQVVVTQNNRPDRTVTGIQPTYVNPGKLDYVHNRQLIFPGDNEYRRFEVINMHYGSQNVDNITFFNPYFHAVLLPDAQRRAYSFDSDHNGRYLVRYNLADDNDTEADYLFVHFTLDVHRSAGIDYYLTGAFTNYALLPEYRMEYNDQKDIYECTALLKMGSYDYQYIGVTPDGQTVMPTPADGSFYETENEYTICVYHRPFGGRYDRLVAVETIGFAQE